MNEKFKTWPGSYMKTVAKLYTDFVPIDFIYP